MPAPPTDTEILGRLIFLWNAEELNTLAGQMAAGMNPEGFMNPGVALIQLRLAVEQKTAQQAQNNLQVAAQNAGAAAGQIIAQSAGAIGTPAKAGGITQLVPPFPQGAGQYPRSPSQQPTVPGNPDPGAIGIPQAPAPHIRRTPQGAVVDQVIVDLVNDP